MAGEGLGMHQDGANKIPPQITGWHMREQSDDLSSMRQTNGVKFGGSPPGDCS